MSFRLPNMNEIEVKNPIDFIPTGFMDNMHHFYHTIPTVDLGVDYEGYTLEGKGIPSFGIGQYENREWNKKED
jgi:hypothetical protein